MPGTRKLGRTSDHRKAMLRAMVTFLFETGKIETTATRAKEVRAMAEKMVTLGKRKTCMRSVRCTASSRKRAWQRRSSTRSARNAPTATAVTPVSSRLVCAAATPPKWRSSNWFKFCLKHPPCRKSARGMFLLITETTGSAGGGVP